MLHPIMPFFTEHVWDKASKILKKETLRISQSKWPEKIILNKLNTENVSILINLITAIRSTRAELNVPSKTKIKINYINVSSNLEEIIESNRDFITSLTRSESFEKKEYSKEEGMVQVIFNDGLIYLSLKGIIDFDEEKNRLQRKLEKIETEINKIQVKLKDDNFVNNGPNEIIKVQKERKIEYQRSKEKITKTMQSFK